MATKWIKYVGPSRAVEIAATGQVAHRNEPVEVDAELAAALLEQGCEIAVDEKGERTVTPVDPQWKTTKPRARKDT